MAYDAPLPRLTAFTGRESRLVRGSAGVQVSLSAREWREFERRDRITAWDALAQWAVEPNPFYESWYLLPALRALAGEQPVKLLALEADGQLAGLLPVVFRRSYYGHAIPHLANWLHPNCFLGQPLVARGFERMFWRELLAHGDRTTRIALFLHLSHMPDTGPLHDALVAELAAQSRPAARVHAEERAMLASELGAEDYFAASLSTKKRKELRRQHRRLEELGELTMERLTDYSDIADWSREFLALEAGGWKGKAGSALDCDPRTAQMFSYAVAGAAARGKLERLALRLDGEPIAMLANFLTRPGAYSFKTAFDEKFARYSPGVLLQRENLSLLEREGIAWADSCAAEDHPMIDHIWRERRTIARYNIALGGPIRRAAFAAIARRETGQRAGALA